MFQEGVTGTWFAAWVLLYQRTLIYTKSLDSFMAITFGELDLRKARCIGKHLFFFFFFFLSKLRY